MSTFITLVNFLVDHSNYILLLIIFSLLVINTLTGQDVDSVKKDSYRLINFDINSNLQVSFCIKYDEEINIPIFLTNITNALESSTWDTVNKSPEDPALNKLQKVLFSYGYHNVIFKSIEEHKHSMGTGMNR